MVSLFDLAPNGVYPAAPVAGGAVRSYRTGSPLPDLFSQPSAVYFLWHCSSPRGVRPLTGILLYGARTFLRVISRAATVWPASVASVTPNRRISRIILHRTAPRTARQARVRRTGSPDRQGSCANRAARAAPRSPLLPRSHPASKPPSSR